METFLEIDGLTVNYQKRGGAGGPAVDRVSLKLEKNEILVVVGESGSGKSTLIRAVMGLLPRGGKITEGRILIDGVDLAALEPAILRSLRGRKIAMMFQDARSYLNPRRKIGSQFVESLRGQLRIPAKEARIIALDVLAGMHLPDPARVMDSYTFELSSGMCQRIAFAMAISEYTKPELLLADEPTSALDVMMQAQVIRQILAYRERSGAAVILVTHNIGVAAYVADSIAVMQQGRLVEWGPRDQVILEPGHEYTRALLAAVPKMGALDRTGVEAYDG